MTDSWARAATLWAEAAASAAAQITSVGGSSNRGISSCSADVAGVATAPPPNEEDWLRGGRAPLLVGCSSLRVRHGEYRP